MVARHPHAQEVLKEQLHTDCFRREYLAVCEGILEPPVGTIEEPLGPKPGSLVEQMVRSDGKFARTHYEVVKAGESCTLVRLVLDTGRTHQIRVHLAHLGHPLVGDFLYGKEEPERIPRPALHSHRLTFRHPITGQEMGFTAPVTQDMKRLLDQEEL